jgi:hypothetical protein
MLFCYKLETSDCDRAETSKEARRPGISIVSIALAVVKKRYALPHITEGKPSFWVPQDFFCFLNLAQYLLLALSKSWFGGSQFNFCDYFFRGLTKRGEFTTC